MKKRALFVTFVSIFAFFQRDALPAETVKQPVTINGDSVEFKADGREAVAEGHVEITYQDARLTCDRVRVFMEEKIVIAEGHVRFSRTTGEHLEGEMIVYDFSDQTGTIVDSYVRMPPYYGATQIMEKVSATEFLMTQGKISTCDLPRPHYAFDCGEVKMDSGRTMTAKDIKLSLLGVPIMYLPRYSQRMTDQRPRFMITPGHKDHQGNFVLGSWRYYLNENVLGRLHFDWFERQGWGEGIDTHYNTRFAGVGNLKYYRVDEENPEAGLSDERYRAELRHAWQMTDRDRAVLDFFKESDLDFRKDYFEREYEKETSPASYFLYTHTYPDAMLSLFAQPRINRFDDVLQKLPQLQLDTLNQRVFDTPFYFKSLTDFSYLSDTAPNVSATQDVTRLTTANQLSYLWRSANVNFRPFAGHTDIYYSRGVDGQQSYMQGMFFSGLEMSSKLFKVYDVTTDALHLDINKLRHVMTPMVAYRYQHDPTVARSKLQQMDERDDLQGGQVVVLQLENKLQTKRDDKSVDLVDLLLTSDYIIERTDTTDKGFQLMRYDFEFKPYAWWEFDSDGEYNVPGGYFERINADFWGTFGKTRGGLGYLFEKDESSQITASFTTPLNLFWKLGVYERFEAKTGDLEEQQYTLTRDLHCWLMEFIVRQEKGEGLAFLVAFKIKAFPNLGLNVEKSLAPPRSE